MKKLPRNFELDKYGLHVRFVQETDAEFIVKIRSNSYNSLFLHSEGLTIEKQVEWIKLYKEREARGEDYYLMFTFKGERVGVIRLYNLNEDDFHCGSWTFDDEAPSFCGLAGGMIGREIGFNMLGKSYELNNKDGIDSRNVNIQRFMKMMGIRMTGERYEGDRKFLIGELSKEDFFRNEPKVLRFIPKQYIN